MRSVESLWFGVDDADMAVFTPLYCSITESPECYRVGNGDIMNFSWTSAFWIHNWVANQAYGKYSFMIKRHSSGSAGIGKQL